MRSFISNFIWEMLECQKPVRVDFSTFLHLFCDSIHTIMILISHFSKNIYFQKIKLKTQNMISLKTPNLPGYILTPSELWERPSEAVHPNSLQGVLCAVITVRFRVSCWECHCECVSSFMCSTQWAIPKPKAMPRPLILFKNACNATKYRYAYEMIGIKVR